MAWELGVLCARPGSGMKPLHIRISYVNPHSQTLGLHSVIAVLLCVKHSERYFTKLPSRSSFSCGGEKTDIQVSIIADIATPISPEGCYVSGPVPGL